MQPAHCTAAGILDQCQRAASAAMNPMLPNRTSRRGMTMSLSASGWPFWIGGFSLSRNKPGSTRAV